MSNKSSQENHHLDSSTSEEKEQSLSDILNRPDEFRKLNIDKNLILYFTNNCSYVSLTPIIQTNKLDLLFKAYNIPISKEEIFLKIKNIVDEHEAKIDKIYISNNIKIHKSRGNIIIIDEQFNKKCLDLAKNSNNATQLIADKIASGLFNTKAILYKYEKNVDDEKSIYVIANLKPSEPSENIFIKSDSFESEKNARNDANKKIIAKYLPKKVVKELKKNIDKLNCKEDQRKTEQKERYEKYLSEAGNDRKLLNIKRKISLEEFSKRLPYFNMLKKDKKKSNNMKNKLDEIKKDNSILLDEEKEEFFINTKGAPIKEILLGDPNIVNYHLRDFKYTPLKLFEMIRDSEKYRGVDLKIEYGRLNDKNYSVKFKVIIISQKLGIEVEGFGNSKEEAANKCSLNLLTVLFKNIFKTYHELHDYFEHKNKRYLDIILKNENDENINENIQMNSNYKRKKVIDDSDSSNSKEENHKENDENRHNNSQNSSNGSQENLVRYSFDQSMNSEFMNYTSSDINIINNLNNYNSSSSSYIKEKDYLMKDSSSGSSENNFSLSARLKRKYNPNI